MKLMFKRVQGIVFCIFTLVFLISSVSYAGSKAESSPEMDQNTIAVTINYGDVQPARTVKTMKKQGQTALQALQAVADVEIKTVGEYVVVTAIDGVKGERGVKGWYYMVNGKPAKKVANNLSTEEVKTMTWNYKTDVCSAKVDGKLNKKKEKK